MNKRGQVFVISALIIVGVIISLVRVSNQGTSKKEPEAFFDLSKEISFETKRVLDYGVINSVSNTDRLDHAKSFLNNYSENIKLNDVAFVYVVPSNPNGEGGVFAYYYESTNVKAVSIFDITNSLILVNTKTINVSHNDSNKKATIRIDEVDYVFNLKPGQNFYFVISRNEDGEKYVTVK